MCLSSDASTLVVAGRDGSLVVFDVRDGEGRPPAVEGNLRLPWAAEVQVTPEYLDSKRHVLRELRESVAIAYKVHVSSDQIRRDGECSVVHSARAPCLTAPLTNALHPHLPPHHSPHLQSTPWR
jgi:hypothetical protein